MAEILTHTQLPSRFRARLEESPICSHVLAAVATLDPWIAQSGTPFFRDYTDHGPRHVSEVLETCESLVREDSWDVVSGNDAAVLILAVVLHDAANHLQEDGFLKLIHPGTKAPLIKDVDRTSWSELWERFVAEHRSWKPATRRALLGFEDPVTIPDLRHPTSWTRAQYDLIGEFLRRHHPRLAHEMACFGIPGPADQVPLYLAGIAEDFRDLVGWTARSHGMPLRSALGFLEKNYHRRTWKGVHAPFLMVLLRVADYLQIQASRAPAELLKVKRLRSPTSRREWAVHHAIGNITADSPDPEAVQIQILPHKVDLPVVLRLREWLTGIQHELDESWAVLGEIYGESRTGLDRLGLTLRRVRSDLDDLVAFERRIDFVPEATRLRVAGSELVGLLSRPLYGESPGIAVRELIQNAVDAVWELRLYCIRRGINLDSLPFVDQDAHVRVSCEAVDEGRWRTLVTDQGIGMTVDTVRDHFLTVGQSLRKTEAWGRFFLDDRGRSLVPRSGRFGIGVLAAFLLGDNDQSTELRVSTRHVDADRGLRFSTRLGGELITLYHCDRPVGTTIEVWTSNEPRGSLSGHYHLTDPAVEIVEKNGSVVEQKSSVPARQAKPEPPWRRMFVEGFESIDWRLERGNVYEGRIFCNGLSVPHGYKWTKDTDLLLRIEESRPGSYRKDHVSCSLTAPMVSIFDPDATLPLTLDRRATIGNRIPFEVDLATDLRRNLIAFYLVHTPAEPFWKNADPFLKLGPPHTSTNLNNYLFYTHDGFGLATPGMFSKLGRQRVFLAQAGEIEELMPLLARARDAAIVRAQLDYSFFHPDYEETFSYHRIEQWFSGKQPVSFEGIHAFDRGTPLRAVVRKSWLADMAEDAALIDEILWNSSPEPNDWLGQVHSIGDNLLIDTGLAPESSALLEDYLGELEDRDRQVPPAGIVEFFAFPDDRAEISSPLEREWDRYIRQAIIPCDPARRRRELRDAFEDPDLRPHVEYWEAMPAASATKHWF